MPSRLRPILLSFALGTTAPLASALPISYYAALDGPAEAPPNASPGHGSAWVTIDTDVHSLAVHIEFADLLGTTTAAHIHGPTATAGSGTAGVITSLPTFAGFPLGVSSGIYDALFDLGLATSYNPAFVTALGGSITSAEAALADALAAGTSYLNIHSSVFAGGEIRGFLVQRIAEPGSLALLAVGAGLGVFRRRRTPRP